MTEEQKAAALEHIKALSTIENLSVENMNAIDALTEAVKSDNSDTTIKEWQEKYEALNYDYMRTAEENARIVNAYRERWDASTTGTMVNGVYVDKTVTRVTDYTYDNLMEGIK